VSTEKPQGKDWKKAPKTREFEDVTSKFTVLKTGELEQVSGELVAVGSRDFTDDATGEVNSVRLYTLENDDGSRFAVLGSTDLDQQMSVIRARADGRPGDYVQITLIGTGKTKQGRPIKTFKVERATT
jgi:hypothetical protein